MRGKGVLKSRSVMVFLCAFVLKIGIQVVSNILYVLFSRLDSFFWDTGILWVLLGCFLVSLELYAELCVAKNLKKHMVF